MSNTVPADGSVKRSATGEEYVIRSAGARRVLGFSRILLGFEFLWTFFDKTFGLNYSTPPERAWINGGTPAQGFIKGLDPEKPFTSFYQSLASPVADFLFQLAMLGLGLALLLGIGMRVAAVVNTIVVGSMYLATLPIVTGESAAANPLVDYHLVYVFVVIGLALAHTGDTWGLGKWWKGLVGKQKWLI